MQTDECETQDTETFLNIRLPLSMRRELESVAKAEHRTASQQVRHFLDQAIEARKHAEQVANSNEAP